MRLEDHDKWLIDTVAALQDEYAEGNIVGLNLATGEAMDPMQEGVYDSFRVLRNAIASSTGIASNLLLCDEMLKARQMVSGAYSQLEQAHANRCRDDSRSLVRDDRGIPQYMEHVSIDSSPGFEHEAKSFGRRKAGSRPLKSGRRPCIV